MRTGTGRVTVGAALLIALFPGRAAAVRLTDGTPLRVRLVHFISSETSKVGDQVELEVLRDVAVDDRVVIGRGTRVTGMVVEAARGRLGFFARSGRLAFRFDQTTTVDGQTIRLRASLAPQTSNRVVVARTPRRHLLVWAAETATFDAFVDGDYEVQTAQRSLESSRGCAVRRPHWDTEFERRPPPE